MQNLSIFSKRRFGLNFLVNRSTKSKQYFDTFFILLKLTIHFFFWRSCWSFFFILCHKLTIAQAFLFKFDDNIYLTLQVKIAVTSLETNKSCAKLPKILWFQKLIQIISKKKSLKKAFIYKQKVSKKFHNCALVTCYLSIMYFISGYVYECGIEWNGRWEQCQTLF